MLNFCIKCFKGHVCLNYHGAKGWGLKCDSCHFRVSILQGAARVLREEGPEAKCPECDSFMISATYKPGDRTPFPGTSREHTGCILCDSMLRSTIVNFFVKKQQHKKAPEDMTEEDRKAVEEARRRKEEKKKLKQETGAAIGEAKKVTAGGEGKKKKVKTIKVANLLTKEEMMNDFIKKQFGGI